METTRATDGTSAKQARPHGPLPGGVVGGVLRVLRRRSNHG